MQGPLGTGMVGHDERRYTVSRLAKRLRIRLRALSRSANNTTLNTLSQRVNTHFG
jgi:hypothetical protein